MMPVQRTEDMKVGRGARLLSHDWEPMLDRCTNCRRVAPNHHERTCAKCGASMLVNELIWNRSPQRVATRCARCNGQGVRKLPAAERTGLSAAACVIGCEECGGSGWLGIDPKLPTDLRPGDEAKVIVMAVRYAAGVPFWNPLDFSDRVPLNVIVVPEPDSGDLDEDDLEPRRNRERRDEDWIDEDEFDDEEALLCA